jgi:hypothetical protein
MIESDIDTVGQKVNFKSILIYMEAYLHNRVKFVNILMSMDWMGLNVGNNFYTPLYNYM